MSPKERYLALLEGADFDFHPRIPIVMQFAAEYIGSNYGGFASDHRVLVEANIRCAEDFGFEQLSCISDPYREASGLGGEVVFHKNAVPECVKQPLDDIENAGNLIVPDPKASPRMRDRIDAIRLYKERTGDRYSILGWVEGPAALAGDVRGISDLLMDLVEEPEAASELLELCTETSIRFARAQITAGADTIGVGDAICSQISGRIYSDLIHPCQRRLFEAIHEAGARVRVHICGQTRHLWPTLTQLSFDIFDADHMVDLTAAREAMPHVVLAGNHDPVSDILRGTPAAIREKTLACRESAGRCFMVNAGCEIPSTTAHENLRSLCEPLPMLSR